MPPTSRPADAQVVGRELDDCAVTAKARHQRVFAYGIKLIGRCAESFKPAQTAIPSRFTNCSSSRRRNANEGMTNSKSCMREGS